jgi:CheY-like chemotaxis protein
VKSKKKHIENNSAGETEIINGDYITVSVIDSGIGMNKEVQQHIFEPFFTTKDRGKGTGLGLSVVYGVVNSHNGFITVHSEPSHGSQFTMHFPLLSASENLRRDIRHSRLERGTEQILIVDDEKDVAEVISGMLVNLGYHMTIVDSGQKAINLFKKKKKFDVVILDLNMPKMSGKETFEKIKKIDAKIPVIISTGYSDRDMDVSKWNYPVNAFLQKPYTIEELSKAIRQIMDDK